VVYSPLYLSKNDFKANITPIELGSMRIVGCKISPFIKLEAKRGKNKRKGSLNREMWFLKTVSGVEEE